MITHVRLQHLIFVAVSMVQNMLTRLSTAYSLQASRKRVIHIIWLCSLLAIVAWQEAFGSSEQQWVSALDQCTRVTWYWVTDRYSGACLPTDCLQPVSERDGTHLPDSAHCICQTTATQWSDRRHRPPWTRSGKVLPDLTTIREVLHVLILLPGSDCTFSSSAAKNDNAVLDQNLGAKRATDIDRTCSCQVCKRSGCPRHDVDPPADCRPGLRRAKSYSLQ